MSGNDSKRDLTLRNIWQGSILKASDLDQKILEQIKLNKSIEKYRNKKIGDSLLAVVLSQNCDISNPNEPYIEVLIFSAKSKPKASDKSIMSGKNTRKIALENNGETLTSDINNISYIEKDLIADTYPHWCREKLDKHNTQMLTKWRINRYIREPFPHRFNEELIFNYIKKPSTGFEDFVIKYRDQIYAFYVFLDPSQDESADNYLVSITAVLFETCDQTSKTEIESELKRHISEIDRQSSVLTMLQTNEAMIPADFNSSLLVAAWPEDFTLQDVMSMKELNIDYLCWSNN